MRGKGENIYTEREKERERERERGRKLPTDTQLMEALIN